MRDLILKFFAKLLGHATPYIFSRFRFLYKKHFSGDFFSQNGLDKQLEKYVNYNDGFYVELGANDGVAYSNSLYFELRRNWKGILVEPSPNNFLLCKERRSQKNNVFCNACVSFDYKEKYVDIKYANLMSISENLELDVLSKDSHINSGKKFLRGSETVFSFGAIAKTLNSILLESNAPFVIDFLSLDVEGAELEVLKGIDFDKFSFKFILLEVRNLERMISFLEPKGYILKKQCAVHDYIFEYVK